MRELENPETEAARWARTLPKLTEGSQEILDYCKSMFAATTFEECEQVLSECAGIESLKTGT
jgi:hypothetical protein